VTKQPDLAVENEEFTSDPGCLPAWDVGELPAPAPFRGRNLLRLIGPGIVMAGGAIGTGEWVMGPAAAALYGGAMLWVVVVSIVAQVIFNTEAARYTLYTGEPIFTGYMRTRPGPKFWVFLYMLLDFGSWWPALAGLAAQILVVALLGLAPQDDVNPLAIRYAGCGVFMVCALLVLFGGKVYNTLEVVLGTKLFLVLAFLLIVDLCFVPWSAWGTVWNGFFNPTRVPEHIDWALIAALVGYAGVGGMGNSAVSNYVREKGWGMGGKVGAIPSAFGGHRITLSHIGMVCRRGPEATARMKMWWKYLMADQYLVWAPGSLIGMALPAILGFQYLGHDADYFHQKQQWRAAAALAQNFGAEAGDIFRTMTLICGFLILFPSQLGSMDHIARRWADALWTGSRRARRMDTHRAKYFYYAIIGVFVLWGLVAFTLTSPPKMMLLSANAANLAIATCIFHTLHVNRRFLPPEFRPSPAKQVAMALAGMFFLTVFGLVVKQTLWPMLRDMIFGA
jgi:Mn2+/Fe2+ NRAMP family transporter